MIDECLHMRQNVNENGYRMINPQDYRVNGCRQKMRIACDGSIYGHISWVCRAAAAALPRLPWWLHRNQCPARVKLCQRRCSAVSVVGRFGGNDEQRASSTLPLRISAFSRQGAAAGKLLQVVGLDIKMIEQQFFHFPPAGSSLASRSGCAVWRNPHPWYTALAGAGYSARLTGLRFVRRLPLARQLPQFWRADFLLQHLSFQPLAIDSGIRLAGDFQLQRRPGTVRRPAW